MNNIGIGQMPLNTQVAPYSPVGKSAVGLENAEAKDEPLAPVEEGAENAQLLNRKPSKREESEAEAAAAGPRRQQEGASQQEMDAQQQLEIRELASRDREVRAHEAAHSAVGGHYAGSPHYSFERGPDGVNYAVEGEVPITMPLKSDPELLLEAAEIVRRAALAPAEPSAQDLRVAASAERLAQQARAELAKLDVEAAKTEREERSEESDASASQVDESEQARDDEKELAREERRSELREELQRRIFNLSERLVTLDQVDKNNPAGAVLDQLI